MGHAVITVDYSRYRLFQNTAAVMMSVNCVMASGSRDWAEQLTGE